MRILILFMQLVENTFVLYPAHNHSEFFDKTEYYYQTRRDNTTYYVLLLMNKAQYLNYSGYAVTKSGSKINQEISAAIKAYLGE